MSQEIKTRLQEVNLEKAMKEAAAGKEVLILTTFDDGSRNIESLSDILKDTRFLVEVPGVINEEFEEALTKAVPPRHRNRQRESQWMPGRSEHYTKPVGRKPRLQMRWA